MSITKEWVIPAKTFLVGEYAALAGNSAILLTTTPCFKMTLTENQGLQGIHPESPAGKFWLAQHIDHHGLAWFDPYNGCGGLGASSAQFVGAWLASCDLRHLSVNKHALLESYHRYAWQGQGLRPSGYDVIAQSERQCVYINQQRQQYEIMAWPFDDLAFLLVHSGKKMATHHHLQEAALPDTESLSLIVERAKQAFLHQKANEIIAAVNHYHQALSEINLVAPHSIEQITTLKNRFDIAAMKGCGAMGADVFLMIDTVSHLQQIQQVLHNEDWQVLATTRQLFI